MMHRKRGHCDGVARSNPVLKIPIILLIAWLAPGEASAATLRETLAQKLAEYCIPKDDTTGSCTGPYTVVKYDPAGPESNKCKCPEGYRYDTVYRTCEVCEFGAELFSTECDPPMVIEDGLFVKKASGSVESCPAGSVLSKIVGNDDGLSCPTGSITIQY